MSTRLDLNYRNPASALEFVLSSHAALSPEAAAQVRANLGEARTHPQGAEVAELGPCAVVSGCAAWVAHMTDGRRQILSLALPGEMLDGPSPPDLSIVHVAMVETHTVDVSALQACATRADAPPDLALAWRRMHEAAAMRRVRHTLRLGRMSAYERAAHLLMELHERQRRVKLADERSMPMPLTQEMLADLLGLSAVHMNRTLQQLRRDGVIVYRSGRVVFASRERLLQAAGAGPGSAEPVLLDSRRF